MLVFQQSEATAGLRRFPIYLVDPSDGITPVTGETGTPTVSKNGAAFAATTNALVEVGTGHYYVELTATELDTLGMFTIHYASANVVDFNLSGKVVPWDPFDANLGLTNLDAAISSRSSHAASAVLAETLSELSQGQPAATPTLADAIMLLYMAMRNAETQDASEYTVQNDAGTVVAKSALSDDGTTVSKAKMASGP